jgi:hypothetical protein
MPSWFLPCNAGADRDPRHRSDRDRLRKAGRQAAREPAPAKAGDGHRGYRLVLALWSEQDVIVADEFRDGQPADAITIFPGGASALRVVAGQQAIARRTCAKPVTGWRCHPLHQSRRPCWLVVGSLTAFSKSS